MQRTYVTPGLDNNVTMTASGSTYYYLTDGLGSIRQLIDSNEATQNSEGRYAPERSETVLLPPQGHDLALALGGGS